MKNENFVKLVLAGMTIGILSSHSVSLFAEEAKKTAMSSSFIDLVKSTGGNVTFRELDEEELLLELNEEGAHLYHSLSPEGKQLALKIASRSCNNTNDCKGENACRTDKNSCAGLGECKGQTKCAFSDKNQAVKIASKKMAMKRQGAFNQSG